MAIQQHPSHVLATPDLVKRALDLQMKKKSTPVANQIIMMQPTGKGRPLKEMTRTEGGAFKSKDYDRLYLHDVYAYRFDSIQDLYAVLVYNGTRGDRYALLDVPRPHIAWNDVRRLFNDSKSGPGYFMTSPAGNLFYVAEVDDYQKFPKGFDPKSAYDWKHKSGDLGRQFTRDELPIQFHDAAFIIQPSASAWAKGKCSFHLWFMLTRPISREWNQEYTAEHLAPTLDPAATHPVQVLYIAPPVFYSGDTDLKGRPLTEPDPLASCRFVLVPAVNGAADAVTPPDFWMGPEEWEAEIVRRAETMRLRRKENEARKARERAIFNESAKRAKAYAKDRNLNRWERGAFTYDQLQAETAKEYLDNCARRVSSATGSMGLHGEIANLTYACILHTRDLLDHGDIRDALYGPCVDALVSHPARPRSQREAEAEVTRLLDGAFDAIDDGRARKVVNRAAFARKAKGKPNGDTAQTESATIKPADLSRPVVSAETPLPPTALLNDSFESVEAENQYAEAFFKTAAAAWRETLTEKRISIAVQFDEVLAKGGKYGARMPAGTGKTRTMVKSLAKYIIAHKGKRRITIKLCAPSHKLDAEIASALEAEGLSVFIEPSRTKDNCERFPEILMFGRIAPDGGKLFCMKCEHHPRNSGGPDSCAYWRMAARRKKADVIICTHTALVNDIGYDRSEPPLHEPEFKISSQSAKELEDHIRHARIVVRQTRNRVIIGVEEDYDADYESPADRPPPMTLDLTPQLTEDSKRNVIKWIADGLGVEPEKMFIKEKIAGDSGEAVYFKWREIAQYVGYNGHVKMAVRYIDHGFRPGLHITMEPAILSSDKGRGVPDMEHKTTFPVNEESKDKLVDWLMAKTGTATFGELETWARTHAHEYNRDVLVIDESLLNALTFYGTLTQADLESLAHAGEVYGEGVGALIGLMMDMQNKEGEGANADAIYSDTILEHVDPKTLGVVTGHALAHKRLHESLRKKNKEDRDAILDETWDWQALEALRFCVHNAWSGAYIDKKGLHLSGIRAIDTERIHCAIYMDATMTPEMLTAALGPQAQMIDMEIEQNPCLNVIHAPIATGPRAHLWGDLTGPSSKRAARQFMALLHQKVRLPDMKTLIFMHKRHLQEQADCWLTEPMREMERDGYCTLEHHGSDRSRGSNDFHDFNQVLMTDYFAPKAAKRMLSELLSVACGVNITPEDRMDWLSVAAWIIEGAQMEQEIARIRGMNATPDAPKTIIFATTIAPEDLGYATTTRINMDMLVWDTFGLCPNLTRDPEEGSLSRDTISAILSDIVDRMGGAIPVGRASRLWGQPLANLNPISDGNLQSLSARMQEHLSADSLTLVANRVQTWADGHTGGAGGLARAAGMSLTSVRVLVGPTKGVSFIHAGQAPPMANIRTHLAQLGVSEYVDPTNGTVQIIHEENSRMGMIKKALARLTLADIEGASMGDIMDRLAAHDALKTSVRTLHEWLKSYRMEGEDNRAVLVRMWLERHAITEARFDDIKEGLVETGKYSESDVESVIVNTVKASGLGCVPSKIAALIASLMLEGKNDPNGEVQIGAPAIPSGAVFFDEAGIDDADELQTDSEDDWSDYPSTPAEARAWAARAQASQSAHA